MRLGGRAWLTLERCPCLHFERSVFPFSFLLVSKLCLLIFIVLILCESCSIYSFSMRRSPFCHGQIRNFLCCHKIAV
jgi:hypothetical protein